MSCAGTGTFRVIDGEEPPYRLAIVFDWFRVMRETSGMWRWWEERWKERKGNKDKSGDVFDTKSTRNSISVFRPRPRLRLLARVPAIAGTNTLLVRPLIGSADSRAVTSTACLDRAIHEPHFCLCPFHAFGRNSPSASSPSLFRALNCTDSRV